MKKRIAPPEPIRSEKNFWTIKDAARYLGLRDTTLYAWLNPNSRNNKKTSKLPGPPPPVYRFGLHKGLRFPIKEFIAWAENFRQGQN